MTVKSPRVTARVGVDRKIISLKSMSNKYRECLEVSR